ncbi:MAG: tRNA pseudouridine(54/55) synthase Pus10 [Methanobacterium sp.]|nr:tRNA pseudouridine(54/55) synthase Pus10 [Methanobacterium sp.]
MENLIHDKLITTMELTQGNICNHCLGRIFSKEIKGPGNVIRGERLKQSLQDLNKTYLKDDKCWICDDLFENMDTMIQQALKSVEDEEINFSNFLVGCRVDPIVLEREAYIHQKLGANVENIKKEINREFGKELSSRLIKEVEFDSPNLVFMVDFKSGNVEITINPIFIESKYRKLVRDIPQTKWPCNRCKGRGCEKCDFTGKMYPETVEELISDVMIKAAKGTGAKFHGAGREDIDVRMLGSGRTFVLEILEPKIRELDLNTLQEEVNKYAEGKVEISEMKYVPRNRKAEIKQSSTDTYKVYKALVEVDDEIDPENLDSLKSLDIINQRTPIRVSHRRADKIRTRKIRKLDYNWLKPKSFEITLECEGGLYIKELISGDEDRSKPSVAEVLGTNARCVQLDVLEVNI